MRDSIASEDMQTPLLSGVAAGRPVSLEELRYFSPVGEEYRLKSASSNSLKTLRPISSSSRAEEGWLRGKEKVAKPPSAEEGSFRAANRSIDSQVHPLLMACSCPPLQHAPFPKCAMLGCPMSIVKFTCQTTKRLNDQIW